jgi:hypothetical protein
MDQAGSNDKIRIVLLVIYRHLVYTFGNDSLTTIFDYKSLLVSSLRPTLNTATLKVFLLFEDFCFFFILFYLDY